MTADWLQDILARHDPLAAWPPTAAAIHDYRLEAQLAVQGLRELQGLGHARTLVADALDQLHPGLYRDVESNAELARRLARVAREIWDREGRIRLARQRAIEGSSPALRPLPRPFPGLSDEERFIDWLRPIEAALAAEERTPREARSVTNALNAALPDLIDAYATATDEQRAAARRALTRFRLVVYTLSVFAARQWKELHGLEAIGALRRALFAESLIDGGLDWRDELLMLRHLSGEAEAAGLPFEPLVREAAALSGARASDLLLSVIR